jgi:two-component system, NarL family, sensor kinase
MKKATSFLLTVFYLAALSANAQDKAALFFSKVSNPELRYLLEKGDSLFNSKSYEYGLPFYKKAIRLVEKTPKVYLLHYFIGVGHKELAQYDSAVYYLTTSIKLNSNNEDYLSKSKSVLGLTYKRLGDLQLADKYLTEAYVYSLSQNDSILKAKSAGNLASLYLQMGDFDKALDFYNKNLSFLSEEQKLNRSIILGNIATTHQELNNKDSSEYYINKSMAISREINDKEGILINLNNLAYLKLTSNKFEEAINYFNKTLRYTDTLNYPDYKKKILFNLSEAYEKTGNSELSLKYLKQFVEVKDQIYDEEKARAIAEMQEKYEASERDRQISDLKLSKKQKEAENLTIRTYFLIGFIILIILLGIALWRIIKSRNERDIAVISATIDAQENERERISQELHDDLGATLGMARMLFTHSKSVLLSNNSEELYSRVDNLLVHANARSRSISHELFSPVLKSYGLEKALEELVNTSQSTKQKSKITFVYTIQSKLNDSLQLNIYRVVQELLNNGIKYSSASSIHLAVTQTSKHFSVIYQDNGVGFNPNEVKKGVGLQSINSRVKRFNGKLTIQSFPNNGSTISAIFPLIS